MRNSTFFVTLYKKGSESINQDSNIYPKGDLKLPSKYGGTCLVPPDLYEFGPTKTCEIGPTGLLKNVLFSKTSEFGPTDFFLDPNLVPLSIY